jgi:CheY-like chemotaxis protein
VLPHARSTTVLVIEDDAALRDLYRQALTIAGYAVVAVEDGIDALRRLDADDFTPRALVLDLELPRLGGRDVQRELASHQRTRDIPIVVVTGTDTGDLDPADFACILRKPVEPDRLVKAVDDCLSRPGATQRATRLLKRLLMLRRRRR